MFETAEVGSKIDKEAYKATVPELRRDLLEAQRKLAEKNVGVVVLVGGVEGAGKAIVLDLLLEWMDARGIEAHAMGERSDEERERPPMWRYWRILPPRGRMAVFLGSWYTTPIIDRVFGRMKQKDFDRRIDTFADFETMLHKEGYLLVKFWLHLSKKEQRRRLKETEADPRQAWRVTKRDWKFHKKYDEFRVVSERALRRTNTDAAPWHIVEATDGRYRDVTVGQILLERIRDGIRAASRRRAAPRPSRPRPPRSNILRNLDLSLALPDKKYDKLLLKYRGELNLLTRRLYEKKRSVILAFEGVDAGGKGGAIRRLTSALDARNYQVISVAAPTDEERARPYLWRFWRHLPRLGRVTIFDRSWYGRVLVERIEGFCRREEWQRAYAEINAFEENLTDFGMVLIKFWMAVSPEEQLRRFQERKITPHKRYKITEEDWRNREKWDYYEAAAVEMIEKTSMRNAPWVVVEGEDKRYARIKVLKTVVKRLQRELQ